MSVLTARQRLEAIGVGIVAGAIRWLPDAAGRMLGAAIGLAFFAVDARHRRLAVAQLQAAFPRRSRTECRAIARSTFIHFGRLLAAILRFETLSPDAMRARVEFEGEERMRTALAQGRGVIIFTGHFGYWELQGIAHALAFPPMAVLARPLDNPALHARLERLRTVTGNRVIYKQGALRRIVRALANNECVGIVMDQHVQGPEGVVVDFFGRPAATPAAAATLALRTGAPLIPVFSLPLSGGRYRMVYEAPVEVPGAATADPVRELTQRCTDVIEMYVRRHPHLWMWMHRRWRVDAEADRAVPGEAGSRPEAPR